MKPFVVTLKSNIDPNGDLIDENIVGNALMVELVPALIPTENPETGEVAYQQGMTRQVGVVWEHKPWPAPDYHAPEELYYLDMMNEFIEEAEDDEDEDDEEVEEEQYEAEM